MIWTFTGTRSGMTLSQRQALIKVISCVKPERSRHGCCHGADRAFHLLVPTGTRELHPSNDEQLAWAKLYQLTGDVLYPVELPLIRNTTMVDSSSALIACPGQLKEILRSGTWMTVRYARKKGHHIIICWPDGKVTEEDRR